MNFRIVCCIAMGVFAAHIGVVMLIAQFRPKPHYTLPPKPNFTAQSTVFVDSKTGEKTIYREITVSTKFAPEASTPPPATPPQLQTAIAR